MQLTLSCDISTARKGLTQDSLCQHHVFGAVFGTQDSFCQTKFLSFALPNMQNKGGEN
jgi:hypothetical protein